jgi:hypothetical protein
MPFIFPSKPIMHLFKQSLFLFSLILFFGKPAFALDENAISQYMTVINKPEKVDFLRQTIQVRFPQDVLTIGDACHYLLKISDTNLLNFYTRKLCVENMHIISLMIFLACFLPRISFANTLNEDVYLKQIVNQLDAVQPLILTAEKAQPKNKRIQFHYTKYKDANGKNYNGLSLLGSTTSSVTGSAGKFVLGQSGVNAANQVQHWWHDREENLFDAI